MANFALYCVDIAKLKKGVDICRGCPKFNDTHILVLLRNLWGYFFESNDDRLQC
jgi:hypothetical protein